MAEIRETELPGIGMKYQIDANQGDQMVVIIHDDGRRELYHYDQDNPEEAVSQIILEDEEARKVASIIGGMHYKPKALENIQVSLQDLVIDWYKIESTFKCINKSIAELQVRPRTGATILAILGKDKKKINPGPDDVIEADMTVVIAGERQQINQLKELFING